jgi:hypothetical protein
MSDLGIGQQARPIQDFERVSQSQHGLNVKVSEDGVKAYGTKSIFGRFVAWLKDDKQTNRTTREQFVQSLEQNYPRDVVDGLRDRLLGDGVKSRPLSTRMVRQVLQEVKTEQARRDLSDKTEQARRDLDEKVPVQVTQTRDTLLKSSGNVMVQGEMRQRNYGSDMRSVCQSLTEIKSTLTLARSDLDDDGINDEVIKRLTEGLDSEDDIKKAIDSLSVMSNHKPRDYDDGLFSKLYESLQNRVDGWGPSNPF